jgi:hypothetical protein
MTNLLSFGLKAYQGSESQEIGRSSNLKGKDECRKNLPKVPDIPVLRSKLVALDEKVKGIIWGSNADYLQIIYSNDQLSQMSIWLHISGLIVESSIIQNSIFSKQ